MTPVLTCPSSVNATAAASCPIATSRPVSFTVTATDNCGGTPSVVCNPPSGSIFAVGTSTVNCTATDGCGNKPSCSFTVTVFSFCLQDETNPGNFVLINAQTGDYIFFCNGVQIASGTGTLNVKGCQGSIDHVKGDRRVHMEWDTAAGGKGAGTAIVQLGVNNTKCQITDKNMSNNTCAVPAMMGPRKGNPARRGKGQLIERLIRKLTTCSKNQLPTISALSVATLTMCDGVIVIVRVASRKKISGTVGLHARLVTFFSRVD